MKKLSSLNEKYFSDVLYKILSTRNPKFHKFRSKFALKFVNRVFNYTKKFNVDNSAVVREYPIRVKKTNNRYTTQAIDLLFFDLDIDDNFVIGIENKFLTEDRENQLDYYIDSLQKLFKSSNVKLVYLTLDGRPPRNSHNSKIVCLSWIDDILCILLELIYDNNENCEENIKRWENTKNHGSLTKYSELVDLIDILIAIRHIKNKKINECNLDEFIDCLFKKYGKNKSWKIKFKDLGNYILCEHEPSKYRVLVPKCINSIQAKHLINIFCANLWGEERIEIDCKLENCFDIENREINMEIAINNYFNKKYVENIDDFKDE